MRPIIVTRHQALVEYIREIGIADETTPVVSHATAHDVLGRCVIGVLPMSLARLASSVVEVPLRLDPADRGRELSLSEVRERAGEPVEYSVAKLSSGHLSRVAEEREALELSEGRTGYGLEAIEVALAAWADEHGLIQRLDRPSAPEGVPDAASAEEIVRLGQIPPPPRGEILSVGLYKGVPCLSVSVSLSRCSSNRCYCFADSPTAD